MALNEKKKQIVQSAVKLFAANGFHLTSMQEIANQIGISKGALYLQFKSKEELIVAIITYYQDELLDRVNMIAQDKQLDPKEKLWKQVYVAYSLSQKNGAFIKMQVKEQLNQQSEEVRAFILKTRARMLGWKKKALVEAYGEQIKPYLWDLVVIFHAMFIEYTKILVLENKTINLKELSNFLVERIDGMVSHLKNSHTTPILKEEMMVEIEELIASTEEVSQEEKLMNELDRVVLYVKELSISEEAKNEYVETLLALKVEIGSEVPRSFMIKAFIAFLDNVPELTDVLSRLKLMLELKRQKVQ